MPSGTLAAPQVYAARHEAPGKQANLILSRKRMKRWAH